MFFNLSLILFIFYLNKIHNGIECADLCSPINVDKINCSYCISRSYDCYWCADEIFNSTTRCGEKHQLIENHCKMIVPNTTTSDNGHLGKSEIVTEERKIQLNPQKVSIELRPQQEVSVDISYLRDKDYPMDLYYLMDLSCTMHVQKHLLSQIGSSLKNAITSTTENARLGFGSYVDKPVMPYAPYNLSSRKCRKLEEGEIGDQPYSFRHVIFTDDPEEFNDRVKHTRISSNLDFPEGTLDALMQVLVCHEHIKWRNNTQKIIVVVSDDEFHIAGDGKLAGILEPNDGLCHMSESQGSISNYLYFNITDYPSMYQIKEKAQGFTIIFSVIDGFMPLYNILANIIGNNAKVVSLSSDTTQAINMIKELYRNITTNVELNVKGNSKFVEVKFYVQCGDEETMKLGSNCTFKKIKKIYFKAVIKLVKCPENEIDWNENFKIVIPNDDNEYIDINLKMLCGCDCDVNGIEKASPSCSKNGTLACGICRDCNGKRTGLNCECDPEKLGENNGSPCIQENSTSICSDRPKAKCVCNKCNCNDKRFTGKYCEIDASACIPRDNSSKDICNGNGECKKDGTCDCHPDFTGKFCECNLANNCTRNGQVCSGNGQCKCGVCKCKDKFTQGDFCEICPSCEADEMCNKAVICVQEINEVIYGIKKNFSELSWKNCTGFHSALVENLNTTANQFKHQCRLQTPDNECAVEFSYGRTDKYQDGKMKSNLMITKPLKQCEPKVDLVVVGSSVIAGTILIGLAILLLWKLLIEMWDRKEYTRFQKELSLADWGESENPLYKEAKSTFRNPMFELKDRAQKRLSKLSVRFSRRLDIQEVQD